jgi:transmembrane 9 superfamily protein 2/4
MFVMRGFILILLLEFSSICQSFYLPGLAPVNYCDLKDKENNPSCQTDIPVYVNRLTSNQAIIPYEYDSFDFCPADEDNAPAENLGQVVFGERIRSSPYNFKFLTEIACNKVCLKSYEPEKKESTRALNFLKSKILLNYQHHWIIDNLPVTWCYLTENNKRFCSPGFPIGCYVNSKGEPLDACVINDKFNQPDTYYIFNHVAITITYHSSTGSDWGTSFTGTGGRIVSAYVEPKSIKHDKDTEGCGIGTPMGISGKSNEAKIKYTYSVTFKVMFYI